MPLRRTVPLLIAAALLLTLSTSLWAQQRARDDENLIKGLMRDRLYDVAADKIFDFVFKYPQHPRREKMLYDISEILVKEGREAKATPLLGCYLQEFPDGPHRRQITMMLARAQLATGEQAAASEILKLIISDSSFSAADNAAAREMLAQQFLSQQRFSAATELIEGTPERRISNRGRLILARAHRGLGRLDEAEATLRGILSRTRRGEVRREARAELATLYVEMVR